MEKTINWRHPLRKKWVDDRTGYTCSFMPGNMPRTWCAYVSVPRSHRLWGLDASGGACIVGVGGPAGDLTYGCPDVEAPGRWMFGFSTHAFPDFEFSTVTMRDEIQRFIVALDDPTKAKRKCDMTPEESIAHFEYIQKLMARNMPELAILAKAVIEKAKEVL